MLAFSPTIEPASYEGLRANCQHRIGIVRALLSGVRGNRLPISNAPTRTSTLSYPVRTTGGIPCSGLRGSRSPSPARQSRPLAGRFCPEPPPGAIPGSEATPQVPVSQARGPTHAAGSPVGEEECLRGAWACRSKVPGPRPRGTPAIVSHSVRVRKPDRQWKLPLFSSNTLNDWNKALLTKRPEQAMEAAGGGSREGNPSMEVARRELSNPPGNEACEGPAKAAAEEPCGMRGDAAVSEGEQDCLPSMETCEHVPDTPPSGTPR
jgi:hypothetical protein